MIQLQTFIFNYGGRFFRFKEDGQTYVCDICYWRGTVSQTADGGWRADIQQKYDPFDHDQTAEVLPSKEDGMRWVASRLIKAEKQA